MTMVPPVRSGRTDLKFEYSSSGSIDQIASRLGRQLWTGPERPTISTGGGGATDYAYAGQGTVVSRHFTTFLISNVHHVRLDRQVNTLDGSRTTGVYPNLDRFGRVKRQVWHPATSSSGAWTPSEVFPYVDLAYDHDLASNPIGRFDERGRSSSKPDGRAISTGLDEVYSYDGLQRLIRADRGTRTSGTFNTGGSGGPAMRAQQWSLDGPGNWLQAITDLSGNGAYDGSGSPSGTDRVDTRLHNPANEINDPASPGNWDRRVYDPTLTTTTGSLNFEYDDNGNLTSQQTHNGTSTPDATVYVYDAWNRLVRVEKVPAESESPNVVRARYAYNGLNWRTVRHADTDIDAEATLEEANLYYYDAAWRLLEERVDGTSTSLAWPFSSSTTFEPTKLVQRVWNPTAVDELEYFHVDSDSSLGDYYGTGGNGATPYHVLTDRLSSVVALLSAGVEELERVRYTPYGVARQRDPDFPDCDGDGAVKYADLNAVLTAYGTSASNASSAYDIDADVYPLGAPDRTIDNSDLNAVLSFYGDPAPVADGLLSDPAIANTVGYAGYLFDPATGLSLARNRWYEPSLGRWMTRDPIGPQDGLDSYEYCVSRPCTFSDPTGLTISAIASTEYPYFFNLVRAALERLAGGCATIHVASVRSIRLGGWQSLWIFEGTKHTFDYTIAPGVDCKCDECWKILQPLLDGGSDIRVYRASSSKDVESSPNEKWVRIPGQPEVTLWEKDKVLGKLVAANAPFDVLLWHELMHVYTGQGHPPHSRITHQPGYSDPIIALENKGRECLRRIGMDLRDRYNGPGAYDPLPPNLQPGTTKNYPSFP